MVELARSGQWTRPLTSMKALACGGGPLSAELIADAEKLLGIRTLRMYGLSECPGHNSTRLTDPAQRRQVWDGVPFPGTHVESYDEQCRVLPRGQVGEAGVGVVWGERQTECVRSVWTLLPSCDGLILALYANSPPRIMAVA